MELLFNMIYYRAQTTILTFKGVKYRDSLIYYSLSVSSYSTYVGNVPRLEPKTKVEWHRFYFKIQSSSLNS